MKIGVIGAGYVGLTTAACLAEVGHEVTCADSDTEKLRQLQSGRLPISEPFLDDLVARNRREGRLEFALSQAAISASTAIFVCVGTPLADNGGLDVSAVEQVARAISQTAQGYRLVVQKSTVPCGGSRLLDEWLRRSLPPRNGHSAFNWDVAANPEFLREGTAVHDFLHPDRIVIGAASAQTGAALRAIYRPIIERQFDCPVHGVCHQGEPPVPVVITDPQTAELIKQAANSYLAMKVSFVNMISEMCETVGADVRKLTEAVGLDPRIGHGHLNPGLGFGGPCLPKDIRAFIRAAEERGVDFSLLREAERINGRRPDRFVSRVNELLGGLRGKRVGVWGLAFKPGTDDVRNSPAMMAVRRLLSEGAIVQAYDPYAMENARRELPEVRYGQSAWDAAREADALLVLCAWPGLLQADLHRAGGLLRRPVLLDASCSFRDFRLAESQGVAHGASITSPTARPIAAS